MLGAATIPLGRRKDYAADSDTPTTMKKTLSSPTKLTCGCNPMTAKIHELPPGKKHPDEIHRLALAAWLKEGARPGLEQQYVEEVIVQLRATRHLLERECLATADAGRETQ